MSFSSSYIATVRSLVRLTIIAGLFFMMSCSPTRRLAEDEYLLSKNKIELESDAIDEKAIEKYEKQKPNKTVLGLKFHLFLYNLAKPGQEKFPGRWFRKIGEEPVVWDPLLTEKTREQFEDYLNIKGYYNAHVEDSVHIKKKKATVVYDITLNDPHLIRSIEYDFEDRGLSELVYSDTSNRLIRKHANFDKELLQQERQRLEYLLKDNGYFAFTKEYIHFQAVEARTDKLVDLTILFKENVRGSPDPITKLRKHYKHKIRSTFVYPNFTLYSDRLEDDNLSGDTVIIGLNHIIYAEKRIIRPEAVLLPNRVNPNDLYRISNVRDSYRNFASLGLYRIVNISFDETVSQRLDTTDFRYLDCYIELSPRKRHAYQIEVVGSNSDLDYGARGNISYNNYNIFRGAENFQVKLTLAREWGKSLNRSLREVGVESSLSLPIFLVPFRAQKFTRKYNPRTTMNVSYNYQDRPEYLRTIAGTAFGYRWKGNTYNTHNLYPVDFNYVQVGEITSEFREQIANSKLVNSFEDHTILAARYNFEYTNQHVERLQDFIYFRSSLESAGSVISGAKKLFGSPQDSMLFNVPYFHYLRYDLDLRFNNQITPVNRIVYRIFAGIGYPLGKSETLPFEKLYFGGGPYGIRAWNSEGLGPGSFSNVDSGYYYNRGEIKLEANLEYRFKLFWKLEGALFVDAGNIWTMQESPDRPGGEFAWDRFYEEIAVGAGLGVRFDFSFLIIRTDFGFKMRDPAIQNGSRWIDFNAPVRKTDQYDFIDRFVFQFGIGYPF